jgi:hypothetical protein
MARISLKGYASLAAGLLWLLMAVGVRTTNVPAPDISADPTETSGLLASPTTSGPVAAKY